MIEQPQKPQSQKKALDNIPFIEILYSLVRSTDALEKTWSESLDKADVIKSHTELVTLWESFTRNLPSWVEGQSAELKELGFNTIIKRYPLGDDEFKLIGESLKPIDRYNQFSIAVLYQTQNVLHALTALKEPTHKETSLPSGKTESWWEAGAFSLMRASIRSLALTLEQQMTVYEELTQAPYRRNIHPAWAQYMDTLRVLLNNELYEAAPPVIVGALRFYLADQAKIPVDKLPDDLAIRLKRIESYATLAHLYGELEKVHQRIGFDATLERDYLVPLVIGSVIQLESLMSQPIQHELIEELKFEKA